MSSRKENNLSPAPDQIGHDFSETDFVLNYKPRIEYEEPPAEDLDDPQAVVSSISPVDEVRNKAKSLIAGYTELDKLIDIAQEKIDIRVKNSGGLEIQLDLVKDAHVIAAIKRRFPKAKDPSKITYDMYKDCLKTIASKGKPITVSDTDIAAAKSDPLQTDFGGLGSIPGTNRPEISSPASTVSPIDLKAFQAAAVLALFKLLHPYIKQEDKKEIAEHLITTPHKPI